MSRFHEVIETKKPLARCPCGEIPDALTICESGHGGKYAAINPACCETWEIEFRTDYHEIDSEECMRLAVEAWNAAPRDDKIIKDS